MRDPKFLKESHVQPQKNMAIQIADDRKTIDSDMSKFVSQKSMVSTKNKKYNW